MGLYDGSSSDAVSFTTCKANGASITGSFDSTGTVVRGDCIATTAKKFGLDRATDDIYMNGMAWTGADDIGTREFGLKGTLVYPVKGGELKLSDTSIFRQCGQGEIRRNDANGPYFGTTNVGRGTFSIESPATGSRKLAVRTAKDFRYEYAFNATDVPSSRPCTFQQGRMTVTASDGSVLEIDAGNGDPATYRLSATVAGRKTTVTRPIEPLMKASRKASYCGA